MSGTPEVPSGPGRAVLFVPLNTNHVLIFAEILKHLRAPFEVLCHDRISGGRQYNTEAALKARGIPFAHSHRGLARDEREGLLRQLPAHFGLRRVVGEILERRAPAVLVLAVDNDPVSVLFLKAARARGIKTVVVQEGSARPAAGAPAGGWERRLAELLRTSLGLQLHYTLHGSSGLFDAYLVSGETSRAMLRERGVAEARIGITGQPKYDPFMRRAAEVRRSGKESARLLYAAGFSVVADADHRDFLRRLVAETARLGIEVTVKLHPRSKEGPEEVRAVFSDLDASHCRVVKGGDETLDLLAEVYGVITVASTVVTEALIMDREGILVDYLAAGQRLPYDDTVVHLVRERSDVGRVLRESLAEKRPFEKKRAALEQNLFSLDGESGRRAAAVIEELHRG